MTRESLLVLGCAAAVIAAGIVAAGDSGKAEERERTVTESEVPAAALQALKRAAGGAAITELAEEIEHGSTFYEGSWKGPSGNVDALVTDAGDLVEIEESVPAEAVPARVRHEVERLAGPDARLSWEKKNVVMYEVHYREDGKVREILLSPDGRRHEDEAEGEDEGD